MVSADQLPGVERDNGNVAALTVRAVSSLKSEESQEKNLQTFSMANSTALYSNITEAPGSRNMITVIVKSAVLIAMLICFFFFLYFITIILRIYFTRPDVRENSRHVLFCHMIINDTVFIIIGLCLYVASVYFIFLPVPICYIILTISTSTFRVTPYNLAAMSLERYVAIIFPLKHLQLCTVRRTSIVIAVVWMLGLMPNIADFIALNSLVEKEFYSLNVVCKSVIITKTPVQNTIQLLSIIITFILVGLIILYTYLKVILVARKIGSGTSSATKAAKTIMLHAFQLLLCLTSLTSSFTEPYIQNSMQFMSMINFLLFMFLPRFLSPLIYGIKDNVFGKHLRKLWSTKY
ncbi:odorant receptor 131-2-like [Discoglossus pictus]